MSDIAIKVENLSKRYKIGAAQQRQDTLRDWLVSRFNRRSHNAQDDILWALKDVSFEVKRGEVLGVIGRNGAGKSTLLKILSRITEPTEGRAFISGRVGSLLEVGTGFHPELTGRENIYLSGTILGMSKTEIDRRFDEIVDFSGVEKFIDTPIKRYSSGMTVRLGFAIAAHLEPEVLLIDEVLAVGDAAFRKKSVGKIGDVSKEGRTVLLISHNLPTIENLCNRVIMFESGMIDFDGDKNLAISRYLNMIEKSNFNNHHKRIGNGLVRVDSIEICDLDNRRLEILHSGQDVQVILHYRTYGLPADAITHVGIIITNKHGVNVFSQGTRLVDSPFIGIPDCGAFICVLRNLPLPSDEYRLSYSVKVNDDYADQSIDAAIIRVVGGDFYRSGQLASPEAGVCLVGGTWTAYSELNRSI